MATETKQTDAKTAEADKAKEAAEAEKAAERERSEALKQYRATGSVPQGWVYSRRFPELIRKVEE